MKKVEEWLKDNFCATVFNMLELRKPGQFTPYEIENKFVDQSLYVDARYEQIQIKEAILLPDNDILIGYRTVYDFDSLRRDWDGSPIYYKKLSDIELSYFPKDQLLESWV